MQDFSNRGGNHLVPITNVLKAGIHLWKKFSSNSCVYALKRPYYNTCADLKGGGGFLKGEVPRLSLPCMNPCYVTADQAHTKLMICIHIFLA